MAKDGQHFKKSFLAARVSSPCFNGIICFLVVYLASVFGSLCFLDTNLLLAVT